MSLLWPANLDAWNGNLSLAGLYLNLGHSNIGFASADLDRAGLHLERGRLPAWRKGLEGINVQESEIVQEWRREAFDQGLEKGIEKGIEKGAVVGQVRLCQELLKQTPTPKKELSALSEQDLSALLAQLRQQLLPNGA